MKPLPLQKKEKETLHKEKKVKHLLVNTVNNFFFCSLISLLVWAEDPLG